ncbi:MAG: peptidase T [Clostridia bacterium]|nr:peptidase T [Clostridia bacterium]
MRSVVERFLEYVKIDTQSSEESNSFPSTTKQINLAKILAGYLSRMGAEDVHVDSTYCYVYANIPATKGREKDKVLGFIAHMDTSPETSGKDVNPQIIENYEGQDIKLGDTDLILGTSVFPELNNYIGKSLIVTDGTTLLGADDKAGIAEIMTMADFLLKDLERSATTGMEPQFEHGKIAIAFTPDEEIGAGVDHFDLERFGADYAYTVDGGGIGELEYENFNAASLDVTVHGVTVHPGEAKGKMKNAMRIAMEFDGRIPDNMRPEVTSGYEGFYHLCDIEGDVETCKLSYIVRDHDSKAFEDKKNFAENVALELNSKYGDGTVEVVIKDSYYNMRDKIEPDYMFLIEEAKGMMIKNGIKPVITPIRGGTDGARLSYMGIPCPNICTGGHNYHGRFEYVVIESMEKISRLLVDIACIKR